MTAHAIITAALLARDMRRIGGITCACCGNGGLLAEEMADESWHSDINTIEAMHRGSVCICCAEDHTTCQDCREPIAPGEEHHLNGDPICGDCLALERRS